MKLSTLPLLVFIFFVGKAVSQNTFLDSLAALVEQLPDDTVKVRRLYELGRAASKENNSQGIPPLLASYSLAKKLGAREWLPEIESRLAALYSNAGALDTALLYVEAAARHYEKLGDLTGLAKAYQYFLYFYKRQGEYEKAAEYGFRSLETYEKANDGKGVITMLGKLGSLFYSLEKWDDALSYTQQSYDAAKKENLPREVAYAAHLLSDIYGETGGNDKAMEYVSKALSIYRQLDDKLHIVVVLNARGMRFAETGRCREAITDYREALEIARSIEALAFLTNIYHNLANCYYALEAYREALDHFEKSMASARLQGERWAEDKTLGRMALAYAGLGRYDSAFYYQTRSKEIGDSLLHVENTNQILELQTQYETEKKAATIAQQQAMLRQQRVRFWLVAGFLALAVVGGAALFRLTRILRKRNEEKEFLIKEIHHRVKNNLQVLSSLLHLQSRHINDGAALDAVREGQNRVEAMGLIHQKLYMGDNLAAVDMRDYLYNLGDSLLDAFGLDESRVKVVFHLQPLRLDVDTAIPLGLIINELVTNSLKYAFPGGCNGVVEISLWKNDAGQLCLKVADDGVGQNGASESKNSTSFGGSLVQILSKKLKGKPQVLNEEGYATLIEFENFKEA
ncbi:MAG: tetratricopeptide repeat protein [Phaeodactylibacter sp.]|nr:tetratricopeptide repeat protein [Phaeodactylibacter sp.]